MLLSCILTQLWGIIIVRERGCFLEYNLDYVRSVKGTVAC